LPQVPTRASLLSLTPSRFRRSCNLDHVVETLEPQSRAALVLLDFYPNDHFSCSPAMPCQSRMSQAWTVLDGKQRANEGIIKVWMTSISKSEGQKKLVWNRHVLRFRGSRLWKLCMTSWRSDTCVVIDGTAASNHQDTVHSPNYCRRLVSCFKLSSVSLVF